MMCPPCAKSDRRPGRHRSHPCNGGGTTAFLGYVCNCLCNQPSLAFRPPMMALDMFFPEPGCPSCDRDLSYPGQPGHECYTYAEHRERIAQRPERAPASARRSL